MDFRLTEEQELLRRYRQIVLGGEQFELRLLENLLRGELVGDEVDEARVLLMGILDHPLGAIDLHLGDLDPQMVMGDHSIEITVYQCLVCEQISVVVVDDYLSD